MYVEGGAKMIDNGIHAQSLNESGIRRLFSFTVDTDIGHLFLSFLPNRHEVKTYIWVLCILKN